MSNDIAIDKTIQSITFSDTAQFILLTRMCVLLQFLIRLYMTMNSSTNIVTAQYMHPNPALSTTGCPTAPSDGFIQLPPVMHLQAGKALSDWSYTQVLNVTAGLQPCPTDINVDGVTNNVDFLILLGKFNQSCN
jgi:hypothetical protein